MIIVLVLLITEVFSVIKENKPKCLFRFISNNALCGLFIPTLLFLKFIGEILIMAIQAFIQGDVINFPAVPFVNGTGASLSATNREIFALATASGKRMAAVVYETNTEGSDNGTGIVTNGSKGSCLIRGAIKIPKSTSVSFVLGETVYWDISALQGDKAATANTVNDFVVGQCYEAAATADSYVKILLNEGADAFGMGSSSSSASA